MREAAMAARQKGDWSGLWVALATPFGADGGVDLAAFRRLVRHVAGGGADVLVPLGTTGEAPTLEERERDAVLAACLEEAGGALVCAGTGHNATARAAAQTKRAQALGAHGALVVAPYYNKPMPRGLVAHFRAVADAAAGLPLAVYNVPGRTGVNVAPDTLAQLFEIEAVVAVKESSGNVQQIAEVARRLPDGRFLLAGDDQLTLPAIAVGACGVVSVVGNLLPQAMKALVDAARAGDPRARRLFHALLPLMDALFVESNPIPVKAGLQALGLARADVRLPLTEAEPATAKRVAAALERARGELAEEG
jgi:4-hydroxy-tetrahydrodipicolinate synthase